nr:SDR family NAD(P)-dependent oxidoreductase [uncultured Roseococcus sp.]
MAITDAAVARRPMSTCASAGFAIVTGGSSGIGWAICLHLLTSGYRVLIIARSRGTFERRRRSLSAELCERLEFRAADVRVPASLEAALASAISLYGPPDWVITCAGVAQPGRFLDLPIESHEVQWTTNYLGTMNTVRLCAPEMVRAGRGRLVLISSAAALGTFYGYSAYSPSKFAVRALGDILRLELRPHGISVTTAFPPDTDTPQFDEEKRQRPPVAAEFLQGNAILSADRAAREIIAAAERGQRHVAPGRGTKLFHQMPRILDAVFRWQQGRLVAKMYRRSAI